MAQAQAIQPNSTGSGGASIGLKHIGREAGIFYSLSPKFTAVYNYSMANVVGKVVAWPFEVGESFSIDRLSIFCATAAAGATARIAIARSDTTTVYKPGAILVESSTLDCASTGVKTATISTTALTAGFYFAALQVSSGSLAFRSNEAIYRGQTLSQWWVGMATPFADNPPNCYQLTHTYGAFPANLNTATRMTTDYPAIEMQLRAA